jgi:quinol monooxygenase YgiN
MSHIAVIATFAPVDGRQGHVRMILGAMVQPTRAEPGCLQYDLYENADGFLLFERYDDDAAVEAHRATDHYVAYRAAIGDLLAGPIGVTITHPVDVG